MRIEKKVSMIFPSKELGKMIANDDAKTQSHVLQGMAEIQQLKCVCNNQAIISLVAILSADTILWLCKLYRELLRQERIPKDVESSIRVTPFNE